LAKSLDLELVHVNSPERSKIASPKAAILAAIFPARIYPGSTEWREPSILISPRAKKIECRICLTSCV